MSVPDKEIFSMQDIATELGCVLNWNVIMSTAVIGGFDTRYNIDSYAPANSMLRFRNYSALIDITVTPYMTLETRVNGDTTIYYGVNLSAAAQSTLVFDVIIENRYGNSDTSTYQLTVGSGLSTARGTLSSNGANSDAYTTTLTITTSPPTNVTYTSSTATLDVPMLAPIPTLTPSLVDVVRLDDSNHTVKYYFTITSSIPITEPLSYSVPMLSITNVLGDGSIINMGLTMDIGETTVSSDVYRAGLHDTSAFTAILTMIPSSLYNIGGSPLNMVAPAVAAPIVVTLTPSLVSVTRNDDADDSVTYRVLFTASSPMPVSLSVQNSVFKIINLKGDGTESSWGFNMSAGATTYTGSYSTAGVHTPNTFVAQLIMLTNSNYEVGGSINMVAPLAIPTAVTPELDNVVNIKSLYVGAQDDTPNSMYFNETGDKLFLLSTNSDNIYEYALTTAFEIDTGYYVNEYVIKTWAYTPTEISFNRDGTKLFVIEQGHDEVYQLNISTPWDLGTLSYSGVKFSISSEATYPSGLAFSNDGMKMFMSGDGSDNIFQYSLSISFDLATASYDNITLKLEVDNRTMDFVFSSDGLRLFTAGNDNDKIYQYNLTTAFRIDTATYSNKSFSVADQDLALTGIEISTDGTKIFVAGNISDTIYQYDLT